MSRAKAQAQSEKLQAKAQAEAARQAKKDASKAETEAKRAQKEAERQEKAKAKQHVDQENQPPAAVHATGETAAPKRQLDSPLSSAPPKKRARGSS